MARKRSTSKPTVHVKGHIKDSNIVVGDNNVVTTIRKYIFRDTRQLVLFIISFLVVTGGIIGVYWYSVQPRKMTGNFNIAVAQFGEIQKDGSIKSSAKAEIISSTLFNFLDSEYRASELGLTVQTAHKNIPVITEDAQAEELAKKINANIVIYGNIFLQDGEAEFFPRFYVAEQAETKELTGQNELAYPIEFKAKEIGSENDVHTELRTRTQILFNFTKGLIYFSRKDPDAALHSLQIAIRTAEESPKTFAGQEVLYLLTAKIRVSQKNYEEASQLLDQALILNPDYARAHLLRGNIFYMQAIESNFDNDLLDDALAEYTLASESPSQPEGAYIPIKAHTAMGNVLVVKAQQTNDANHYDMAIENYNYVIKEYELTQDTFIREYAAIAYFGLGAAYERQGDREQAIDTYQHAYELAEDPEFKSRIEQQLHALQTQ